MRLLLDVSAVPSRPVGAGVYAVNLARELSASDLEVHLATRRRDEQRWRALAPGAQIHAVAPDRRPARLAWEQAGAPALVRQVRPDVWHGIHYTMPLRVDVPCVVTMHDLTFFDHPEWHERTKVVWFRTMMRATAKRAAALIAVSRHTARRVDAVLHPHAPVVVAAHGVDHDRFRPGRPDDPHDMARVRALGVRRPYVAFQGTVEPRKDLPTLVAAFANVATAHPDLRLVLAGRDGWGTDAVRQAVERSGVATRILRPGYTPDGAVPALYRQAEVVAYPSREEGFGLPALEALACGAPLVSTLGSAIEEVVDDAALLVSAGDIDALTAALQALLDDAALAGALRAAGPRRAAGATWRRSAEQHIEAYRLAASGVPHTARAPEPAERAVTRA
ncbi:MAG: glycosyltransferase family 4 protein [Actinobacteria bacterium]|nr:glycosyltransferase family 4 protein [Actinomycetota bacterium]